MPSLVLSRATEADIDELVDPIYAAFEGNDLRKMFFAHDTPASRAGTKKRIAASMKKGGQNVWLKVVDEETGKVISGSWWMIYPNWAPADALTEEAATKVTIDYLEGEEQEMGEVMLRDWMTRRARYMYGHSHILLALLFTHPSFQKNGAGSMQVQWGVALADQLLMPWYVEGTPAGHHLYASYGAKDLEKVRFQVRSPSDPGRVWNNEYTMMRREPLSTTLKQNAKTNVLN